MRVDLNYGVFSLGLPARADVRGFVQQVLPEVAPTPLAAGRRI